MAVAIAEGRESLVKTLALVGAKIPSGALYPAVVSGQIEMVKTLLVSGADAGDCGPFRRSIIHACVDSRDSALLGMMINSGKAKVDLRDVDNRTALGQATLSGDWDICELLLEAKANPLAQDSTGRCPLADLLAVSSPWHTNPLVKRMLETANGGELAVSRSCIVESFRSGDPNLLRRILPPSITAEDQPGWLFEGWPVLWWMAYFGQASTVKRWSSTDDTVIKWMDGGKRSLLHWIGVWGTHASLDATQDGILALVDTVSNAIGGLGGRDTND